MPKIYEHAKNIPEAKEMGKTFILHTARDHGNNFFFG